jgi:hypothetical protein
MQGAQMVVRPDLVGARHCCALLSAVTCAWIYLAEPPVQDLVSKIALGDSLPGGRA